MSCDDAPSGMSCDDASSGMPCDDAPSGMSHRGQAHIDRPAAGA